MNVHSTLSLIDGESSLVRDNCHSILLGAADSDSKFKIAKVGYLFLTNRTAMSPTYGQWYNCLNELRWSAITSQFRVSLRNSAKLSIAMRFDKSSNASRRSCDRGFVVAMFGYSVSSDLRFVSHGHKYIRCVNNIHNVQCSSAEGLHINKFANRAEQYIDCIGTSKSVI